MNKGEIKVAGHVLSWEMNDDGVFRYTYKGEKHKLEKEYIAEDSFLNDQEEGDVHCTNGMAWMVNKNGEKISCTFPKIEEIFSDVNKLEKIFDYLCWGKYGEELDEILETGFESYWDICLGAGNCKNLAM